MQEIAICAVGALVLTLIVVWVFVRAARRQGIKSAVDARRRIGAERRFVSPDSWAVKADLAELEKRMPPPTRPAPPMPVTRKYPGLRAVDSVRGTPHATPSPTPSPDPFLDNPILNPIHPLHHAFVPDPSPAPAPSNYDCPAPSPSSYDGGSSSPSCDSPSPSPSSDW